MKGTSATRHQGPRSYCSGTSSCPNIVGYYLNKLGDIQWQERMMKYEEEKKKGLEKSVTAASAAAAHQARGQCQVSINTRAPDPAGAVHSSSEF